MYADLEKIEARGKRKEEKSKGLFSSFGKKDEPEPDETPEQQPHPEPAPATKPVVSEPPKPAPAVEPVVAASPKPAPAKEPEPPKTAPAPVAQQPAPKPARVETSDWKPPSGGKLKKAEEDLLAYKKWLNHGYKSGVLTKEQCIDMVLIKEIELGLKPPKQ